MSRPWTSRPRTCPPTSLPAPADVASGRTAVPASDANSVRWVRHGSADPCLPVRTNCDATTLAYAGERLRQHSRRNDPCRRRRTAPGSTRVAMTLAGGGERLRGALCFAMTSPAPEYRSGSGLRGNDVGREGAWVRAGFCRASFRADTPAAPPAFLRRTVFMGTRSAQGSAARASRHRLPGPGYLRCRRMHRVGCTIRPLLAAHIMEGTTAGTAGQERTR
jgi:hypothetical protein